MKSLCLVFLLTVPWLPQASASLETDTAADRSHAKSGNKAMWVWRTRVYLQEPEAYAKLLEFSAAEGITDLFLQIVTERSDGAGYRLSSVDRFRSYIRRAGEHGIRIHALDGAPAFALQESHPVVLARVQAVLDYNNSVSPPERFAGIRMDVEPYTLDFWRAGDEARTAVMDQFLRMNRKVIDRIKTIAPDLSYGVDIPFWFDSPSFEIDFEGETADLAVHLIRMADNIGIMAYRNRAEGPNSIYELSRDELSASDAAGNCQVWIGVETQKPDGGGIPESVTFGHLSRVHLDTALAAVETAAASHPSFHGIAIHHYSSFRELTESGAKTEHESDPSVKP